MVTASLANISIRIASVGFLLLLNIQLARSLGTEGYGLLSFTLAWVQLLALVVQFGLPNSLTRSVTLARDAGNSANPREIVFSSLSLVLLLWGVCIAMVSLWFWLIGTPRGGPSVTMPAVALVLFLSLGPVLAGALRGMGLIILSQIPEQLLRPALYCVALAVAAFVGTGLTPSAALWLQAATASIAVGLSGALVLRKLPSELFSPRLQPLAQAHIALPFLVLAVVQGLSAHATILILGQLVSNADLALFRVAVQIVDALNLFLIGISVVIGPLIVQHHARQDWDALQHLVVWAHRGGVVLLIVPVAVMSVWATPLLEFLFGQEYTPANEALRILLAGKLLYAVVGFSGLVLAMSGLARIAVWASFAGLIVTLVLVALLVPQIGLAGAAWAVAVGALSANVFAITIVFRLTGRDLSFAGLKFVSRT